MSVKKTNQTTAQSTHIDYSPTQLPPNTNTKQNAILSIDIGVKNLGFAIFSYDNNQRLSQLKIEDLDLTFDVFNIEAFIKRQLKKDIYDNKVANRCVAVMHFFTTIAKQFNITKVVVERQVPTNTKAMELMYAVVMHSLQYTKDIVVFDPKCKFTYINEPYRTKSKEHKKQSVRWAGNVLGEWFGADFVQRFSKHDKKDDIADAINQCIVHLCHDGLVETGLIRYAGIVKRGCSSVDVKVSSRGRGKTNVGACVRESVVDDEDVEEDDVDDESANEEDAESDGINIDV